MKPDGRGAASFVFTHRYTGPATRRVECVQGGAF
jgi:hypothetical protein